VDIHFIQRHTFYSETYILFRDLADIIQNIIFTNFKVQYILHNFKVQYILHNFKVQCISHNFKVQYILHRF